MNAKVALRPVMFVLLLFISLPYSSGQTNQGVGVQGEDGASQELLKRAYCNGSKFSPA